MNTRYVSLKTGAGFPVLRPAGVAILAAIQAAANAADCDLVISSGSEPMGRAQTDPHPLGEAVDVAIGGQPAATIERVLAVLDAELGPRFTVLYEAPPGYVTPSPALEARVYRNPAATGPHIHVQRKKGTTYP